jgi:predicted glutamate--cysteine ligase
VLSKGFEVEVYTGTPAGEVVGFSDRITAELEGFVREPDSRNVEYTTSPAYCYEPIMCDLLRPRARLRHYLSQLGDYTIIPGSTLALGGSDRFYRSDPSNPYHTYIEQTYGTSVVTASVHINIGIPDPEFLIKACRLIRLEAPLWLALTASSPFIDGKATGNHSSRWATFPKTPAQVPLFKHHGHFIGWTQAQLDAGTMQNVRHLWSSVRPNGNHRPYDLNRLELRICDLPSSPIGLLAVTALLEGRLLQLMADPDLDPLVSSQWRDDPEQLANLADANEAQAAKLSLDAQLTHWQDGRTLRARDWIAELYQQVWPIAKQQGFSCFLSPVQKILTEGNEAQKWLGLYSQGVTPAVIVKHAIASMLQEENELKDSLCEPVTV